MQINIKNTWLVIILFTCGCCCIESCKKLVSVDSPSTSLGRSDVFASDLTATAAILGIYNKMISNTVFTAGDIYSISFLCGLSADELVSYSSNPTINEFYNNGLSSQNTTIAKTWSDAYNIIYACNTEIEGLSGSNGVSATTKAQLLGEAKFLRAFTHFYLVNLFGNIAYAKTSDYNANAKLSQTNRTDIYNQIINDLLDAQNLLSNDYLDPYGFPTNDRVRANKWVATALLARVYLYTGDFVNAEIQSSTVINNSGLFSLAPNLSDVFLKNSVEAIWQLQPLQYTLEASTFILLSAPTNGAISSALYNAFDSTDLRKTSWIDSVIDGGQTYYFPYKYKDRDGNSEYSMVLRLAEQYLIRAEARAKQNNISGAQSDINMIRSRAGLSNTVAGDQVSIENAILHERQTEFFTEWGHRWLDLKRTSKADVVFKSLKPGWLGTDTLYPIPQVQLLNDNNFKQNPGY